MNVLEFCRETIHVKPNGPIWHYLAIIKKNETKRREEEEKKNERWILVYLRNSSTLPHTARPYAMYYTMEKCNVMYALPLCYPLHHLFIFSAIYTHTYTNTLLFFLFSSKICVCMSMNLLPICSMPLCSGSAVRRPESHGGTSNSRDKLLLLWLWLLFSRHSGVKGKSLLFPSSFPWITRRCKYM